MQYINSNLGIPIKPSFADMMSINRYSNATGDSVSSLQSQIRKIESELSSLDVKMQKEQLKKTTNQQKELDAYKKTTILGGFKYRQAVKDYNEARKAIKEANVEMGIIQNKMASLSIDLNQLQSQLVAAGGAPAPAGAPRPLPPSAPPIAPPTNFGPTGGGIGGGTLLDGPTGSAILDGPTGSGGSADTGKSKINYPIVVIGSALVLGVLYFAVVKPA
jgi:hypothetical protein